MPHVFFIAKICYSSDTIWPGYSLFKQINNPLHYLYGKEKTIKHSKPSTTTAGGSYYGPY